MKTYMTSALLVITLISSGCAIVRIEKKDLPPKRYISTQKNNRSDILVVDTGRQESAPKPVICTTELTALGNGYAKHEDFTQKIRSEAFKENAEVVILSAIYNRDGGSMGVYLGSGITQYNNMTFPTMSAQLCIFSKVYVGISTENNGVISYIKKGSPAEKAGLKIGTKILKIDDHFIANNPFAFQIVNSTKNAGDEIAIEFSDKDGNLVTKKILLEAAE